MSEIKVLSTNGVASLLRELGPQFERTAGTSSRSPGARPTG